MPYINVLCMILISTLLSAPSFGTMSVSSYDMDAAVKAQSTSPKIHPNSVVTQSDNNQLSVLGFWFVNSGPSYDDSSDIMVTRMAFNNFMFDSADGTVVVTDMNPLADADPAVENALFYPNPFRFSNVNKGTNQKGGTLHYNLTTDMAIEIHMYDIFGRRIYKTECAKGSGCGQAGKQKIAFNKNTFNGVSLSAGVYFYIFIYENNVVAKGKVAVVP
jgi:hypothetical protein